MKRLYNSEYAGIPAYLMDFGFGGFLGYGKCVLKTIDIHPPKTGISVQF